jgi:hypothetical protein
MLVNYKEDIIMKKRCLSLLFCITILATFLVGCMNSKGETSELEINDLDLETSSEMFSIRDMESGYDEDNSTIITLIEKGIQVNSKNVSVVENIATISDEGTYILRGILSDVQIVVDAEKTDKIQIVLDNVEIGNTSSAPIYVKQADKVFITLGDDSQNRISVKGEFIAIDDNNIDAAIFSKDDLTINGDGTLTIDNQYGNGITSKDDLKVTNGVYNINVTGHGLEGKDSVRIANGEFNIISGKDGINASNSDDNTLGFVYIAGGNFEINSLDDGIHADSNVIIEDGNINIIKSYEGIEGKSIDINGGTISLVASDDGINATGGKNASSADGKLGKGDIDKGIYIRITGGIINIDAAGDGIDSNGDLYITGGETYISGPESNGDSALDYDGTAHISGGIVVATGASGMAENFGNDSTQGSMLITSKDMQSGDVNLKNSSGDEIISYTQSKQYNSVVISTPDLKIGETYTITMGDEVQEIEMTSLIYGNGRGPGGGGRPNFGDGPKGEMPEGMDRPERPEKPEGMEKQERPNGAKKPERSEGVDKPTDNEGKNKEMPSNSEDTDSGE